MTPAKDLRPGALYDPYMCQCGGHTWTIFSGAIKCADCGGLYAMEVTRCLPDAKSFNKFRSKVKSD